MDLDSIKFQIESAIAEVLTRELTLNFCSWHAVNGCQIYTGSRFFTISEDAKANYGIQSCDALGAVMFVAQLKKQQAIPEKDRRIISQGWSGCAADLAVDWDWTRGFSAGWDALNHLGQVEVNSIIRGYYNTEAYDLGVELMKKYGKKS